MSVLFSFWCTCLPQDKSQSLLDTKTMVYTLAWLLWATSYMRTILFCYVATAMACKVVDICSNYGRRFDIKFNALKSQTRVFGGSVPLVLF